MSNDVQRAPGPGDIVRAGLCIGCGACAGLAAPGQAEMMFDEDGLLRPRADPDWMASGPPGFTSICPFSPRAADEDRIAAREFPRAPRHAASVGRYESAWVGHAAEGDFRLRGSSGGLVSWVACELLDKGLVDAVVHVVPCEQPRQEGRFFAYRISRSVGEVREGAQSRYHPIELSEVLRVIAREPGRYAVVGIPCFIKAVQLLRRNDPVYRERIVHTLGLFCGHMKSARFTESLAMQIGVPIDQVQAVEYRHKAEGRPANWYSTRMTLHDGSPRTGDWWHMADGDWGAGFFMAPACNFCDDVVAETADVSFGDAWVEPHSSDWRGTNVMLVRSPVIGGLVERALAEGRLALEEVDDRYVADTQAAGLRQRREGLAWRLARRRGLVPRKRVPPDAAAPDPARRRIYAMRQAISRWSHRMFRVARATGRPWIYLRWARASAALYHALAYHRGRLGRLVAWIESR